MAEEPTTTAWQRFVQRLAPLPVQARRLLCVIVCQAHRGPLRSKAPGRATMPEIHEACGLDVDELQGLLTFLRDAHFISLEGSYPFEELHLGGEADGDASIWEIVLKRCDSTSTPLETVIVNMQLDAVLDT
jgi:hypothetical protein